MDILRLRTPPDNSMNLGTAAWVLGYDKSKGRDEDKNTLSNLLEGQLLASLEDPVQGISWLRHICVS
ncbi:hypothetical protein Hesp01_24920 [Herbidospora sp. NBRC 101105]|nr:hypothetical protein Hesp01_24920 [Herbidospora sp. NBRC 101105]